MSTQNKMQLGRSYWAWAFSSNDKVGDELEKATKRFIERYGFYPRRACLNTETLRAGVQAPIGLILKPDDAINRNMIFFEIGR